MYKKLPKGTPSWLTGSLFWLGGALGLSISIYALIALYGLSAFLVTLFFPHASFEISSSEAIYLGIVAAAATLSGVLTSYLAIFMNGLSRKSIALSKLIWAPSLVTALLIIFDTSVSRFSYHFSTIWVIGAIASFIFAGLLPWALLRSKAAQKLHKS